MNKITILIEVLVFLLVVSLLGNIFQYSKYLNIPVSLEQPTKKDFSWTKDYIEVTKGSINWQDCNEGSNLCARWEDYSELNPLPTVVVKQCKQEGTTLVDGKKVTGLPIGEHVLVGATIRPCDEANSGDSVGIK